VVSTVFLGIDIGTSGIRASCIDADENEFISHHIAFKTGHLAADKKEQHINEQDPNVWLQLLDKLLIETTSKLHNLNKHHRIVAISIDGTSGTLIACKKDGTPLSPALMYNDQQSQKQAETVRRFAPADSAVHGASSSLAKALNLLQKYPQTELFCFQADWLAASLTGKYGISDENNCLKLGYDSINQSWPSWLQNNRLQNNNENAVVPAALLPVVVAPGTKTGMVTTDLIKKYKLAEECVVVAGTTDSNAAVLATGASQLGDAVTSLGSTLVIKLFSDKPLFSPKYGIYSHRLNNHWLVGGASNSGGSVLLQHFSQAQLDKMTPHLKPEQVTGLNYYPLPGTGERFPVNNSNKQNNTSPRPLSDINFFQALLEGIANIEAEGYKKLNALGASTAKRIFTAGGGSKNQAWKQIRELATGIEIIDAVHTEACYGSALLAKQGYCKAMVNG
jgi:sugar (pentulose or hexulose) kinase